MFDTDVEDHARGLDKDQRQGRGVGDGGGGGAPVAPHEEQAEQDKEQVDNI